MKVEINDIDGCNIMREFGDKLESIGIKLVEQERDANGYRWYAVDIDTAEQVFAINKAVGYRLIADCGGIHGIPELTIFNVYL